ncbi:DUF6252 family protein [Flavobacterium orientale]|uniref:Lipoprotein n=1 Tax=Flavobacterium orientale TaxID=1756020 RepID=A0A916XVB3_9FLAO|nr:DUF6252 family protein [Flavobacterium orientale]GGD14353.1 hypothetical protein GCM10011343_01790 [Flavobacterium orientale]
MKSIKLICALLIAGSFSFFTSCSSDDNGGGGGNAAAGTIKAKVDGTNVTTMEMVTLANQVGTMLSIQGNTGGTSSKAFVLNVTTFDGVGTYDIGGTLGLGQANASYTEFNVNLSNPAASETNIWSAPYTGGDKVGEINVSEITATHIKGTFSFSAKNSDDNSMKQITEGSFNVELD